MSTGYEKLYPPLPGAPRLVQGVADHDQAISNSQTGAFMQNQLFIQPAWHYVGAAGEPTLVTDWQAFSASDAPAFFKDPYGIVHFRGAVKKITTGTPGVFSVFQLPAGYWPATSKISWVGNESGLNGSGGTGQNFVRVGSTGLVDAITPVNVAGGAQVVINDFVSLGAVTYYAV